VDFYIYNLAEDNFFFFFTPTDEAQYTCNEHQQSAYDPHTQRLYFQAQEIIEVRRMITCAPD
jgi:hypothetical protein